MLEGQRTKGKRGVKRGRKVSQSMVTVCVKRTSPTLTLAARLARVPSTSLKRRFTSNFSLVFARLFANLHAYINACTVALQTGNTLHGQYLTGPFACMRSIHSAFFSNTCSTGHSRLLGVIIPQVQEFAISDSVYRGLVEVLIRGPCLD